MDIDQMTEEILQRSGYIEAATENGYPQYSRDEAVQAVQALDGEEDIEMLQQLNDGEGLYDIYRDGIGDTLDRLEEAKMIERPDTGDEYVRLTRLSQTYLQYHSRMSQ